MRAAVTATGIAIEYADDLDGALGTSIGGRIQALTGLAPAEELMVLAHEYAHELLHRSDRPVIRASSRQEAVTFVVGEVVEFDAGQDARDYVQLYRGD